MPRSDWPRLPCQGNQPSLGISAGIQLNLLILGPFLIHNIRPTVPMQHASLAVEFGYPIPKPSSQKETLPSSESNFHRQEVSLRTGSLNSNQPYPFTTP
ncbi:hypothetical protein DSO57_1027549 [Entomophthora muscae]|uniref:Uncharacterized protein n=1 Tax=Entomophthora muscae TaxID=34485 RepID=A0ACC2TPK5_9FUNG|nr:hypothetical protein DSO57_1027549 [Entomophthora muscae]